LVQDRKRLGGSVVQVTQASSVFRPTCILLVDHGLDRLGSLLDESGKDA